MNVQKNLPDKKLTKMEIKKLRNFQSAFNKYQANFVEVKKKFQNNFSSIITSDQTSILEEMASFNLDQQKKIELIKSIFFISHRRDFDRIGTYEFNFAYWYETNSGQYRQLKEKIEQLNIDPNLIPKKSLGKMRVFFVNKKELALYIQQTDYLQKINNQIEGANLIEELANLRKLSFKNLRAEDNHDSWVAVKNTFADLLDVRLINPTRNNEIKQLWSLVEKIRDFLNLTQDFQDKYKTSINETQNLIKLLVDKDIEDRFNRYSIADFCDGYPGLPEKLLTKKFRTIGDLQKYRGNYSYLDGIGSTKSKLISNALASFHENIKQNAVLRIDLENISKQDIKLIQAVYEIVENKSKILKLQSLTATAERLKVLDQTSTRQFQLLWLYNLQDNQEKYENDKHYIEDLHERILTESFDDYSVRSYHELRKKDTIEWFKNNAAIFYSIIEKYSNGILSKPKDYSKENIAKEILHKIDNEVIDDSKMNASLRGWQEFGVKYALVQKRVLIGDEMGLGKTLEAIGVIAHLASQGSRFFLVICPASIMINWQREVEKHSFLQAFCLHGNDRDSIVDFWLSNGGVGITTYETLRKLKIPTSFIPDVLVVDEAHNIKHSGTQRAKSVKVMSEKARYIMYLTGTPIENRLPEMIELISTLQPNVANQLRRKITLEANEYKRIIAPVYLRRKKMDVLSELPSLTQRENWLKFGTGEQESYRQAVSEGKFMAMRRCAWLGGSAKESPKVERLLQICKSAKENNEKVIVFSFFRDVIKCVCDNLGNQAMDPIIGGVSTKIRQQIIDEFNQAPAGSVLPAQVIAGGFGLNIQTASIIVFCEPQIKPSLEVQAIARAYRMGQTRPVFVYRLLTEDSIDERMIEMLDTKQQVFNEYANESYISDQSSKAVDTMDTKVVKKIVEEERKRLKLNTQELVPCQ